MYNGIGLSTPRGSGTNGHVSRNLSFVKPLVQRKDHSIPVETGPTYKAPNEALLEHDRKRQVEVKCLELRLRLEDESVDEDDILTQVDDLRTKLLEQQQEIDARRLKGHDVHLLAAAKEKDMEKFRKALRIKDGHVEGAAFDRELQEKLRFERQQAKQELMEKQQRNLARREETKRKRSVSPYARGRRRLPSIKREASVSMSPPRRQGRSPSDSPPRKRRKSPSGRPERRRAASNSSGSYGRRSSSYSPDSRRGRSSSYSRSPVRRRSPSDSRSPIRRRSPSDSRSPVRRRSPSYSPHRRRGRSPYSRSPVRRRSSSYSVSPKRERLSSESRSPIRRRSPSDSRSPVRRRNRD